VNRRIDNYYLENVSEYGNEKLEIIINIKSSPRQVLITFPFHGALGHLKLLTLGNLSNDDDV